MAAVPTAQQAESVAQKFQRLAAVWRAETRYLSSTTKMFTLTATRALSITGVSTNAPFTVNPPTLPVSLRAGEQLVQAYTIQRIGWKAAPGVWR